LYNQIHIHHVRQVLIRIEPFLLHLLLNFEQFQNFFFEIEQVILRLSLLLQLSWIPKTNNVCAIGNKKGRAKLKQNNKIRPPKLQKNRLVR